MQSKFRNRNQEHPWILLQVAGVVLLLCLWFFQDGLGHYWQQKYRSTAPWQALQTISLWRSGEALHDHLAQGVSRALHVFDEVAMSWSYVYNQCCVHENAPLPRAMLAKAPAPENALENVPENAPENAPDISAAQAFLLNLRPLHFLQPSPLKSNLLPAPPATQAPESSAAAKAPSAAEGKEPVQKEEPPVVVAQASAPPAAQAPEPSAAAEAPSATVKVPALVKALPPYLLHAGDKVLFVGDSLMQGIAPHVQRVLSQKHSVHSINLSKQNSGLTYPNFIDWPKEVEETLQNDEAITLLVVFLGANDPWDMPNPRGSGMLPFASAAWEGEYRERIRRILQAARQRNCAVIWLEVPNMRRQKLNDSMHYLNRLYEEEINAFHGFYAYTNSELGMNDRQFVAYAQVPGMLGKQRLRSDDGVHFSTLGQKVLAQAVLNLLLFQPTEGEVQR